MTAIYLPALNRVFHTVPIAAGEALATGAAASLVLSTEELRCAEAALDGYALC